MDFLPREMDKHAPGAAFLDRMVVRFGGERREADSPATGIDIPPALLLGLLGNPVMLPKFVFKCAP
jgi:hypothetical protein